MYQFLSFLRNGNKPGEPLVLVHVKLIFAGKSADYALPSNAYFAQRGKGTFE